MFTNTAGEFDVRMASRSLSAVTELRVGGGALMGTEESLVGGPQPAASSGKTAKMHIGKQRVFIALSIQRLERSINHGLQLAGLAQAAANSPQQCNRWAQVGLRRKRDATGRSGRLCCIE
jgi:hypothetical protein